MAYEEKDGKGTFFPNDRKSAENHPDWKGTVTIAGVQYDLAGWKKQGQRGEYLGLTIKPKQERRAAPQGFPTAQPTYSEDVNF
jgi:uncharacterized protein (DUF736 family)